LRPRLTTGLPLSSGASRALVVVPLRARHVFSPTDSSSWRQYRCRCPLCTQRVCSRALHVSIDTIEIEHQSIEGSTLVLTAMCVGIDPAIWIGVFLTARNGLGTSVILPGSLLNPASSTFTNFATCRPSVGRRRGSLHSFAALPPPPCIRCRPGCGRRSGVGSSSGFFTRETLSEDLIDRRECKRRVLQSWRRGLVRDPAYSPRRD
jgi:hypothetical protein